MGPLSLLTTRPRESGAQQLQNATCSGPTRAQRVEESLPLPGARGPSLQPRLQIWVLPCAQALPHPKTRLWPAPTLRPDFCPKLRCQPYSCPKPTTFLPPYPIPNPSSRSQWHPTPCLYPHLQTDPKCPKLPTNPLLSSRCPPSDSQGLLLGQAMVGSPGWAGTPHSGADATSLD